MKIFNSMTEQEKINRRRMKFATMILPRLPKRVMSLNGTIFSCEISSGKICYTRRNEVLKEISEYDNYEAGVKMLRWLDKKENVFPMKD